MGLVPQKQLLNVKRKSVIVMKIEHVTVNPEELTLDILIRNMGAGLVGVKQKRRAVMTLLCLYAVRRGG